MQSSSIAYQRFSQQNQSLLLSKAEAISQTPYFQATLSIPNLDTETLAFTMSNIKVSDDISLLLVLNENATLLMDIDRPELTRKKLDKMPGVYKALNGEHYLGYWNYQGELYRVALSPSTTHNQLLGILVIGQKLTDSSQLSLIEDVSSAQAMVRYKNEFHSVIKQSTAFNRLLQRHAYSLPKLTMIKGNTTKLSNIVLPEIIAESGSFYAISLPFHEEDAELILYKEQTSLLARLNQFQQIILVVSLFTLILGLFISWLISLKISKPLSQVMAAVKRYSDGDFSAKITNITQDELGDLSLAFNQMGNDIVASRKNLLDRKIAEDEMRKLAFYDELTNLPNRRFFMEKLEKLISNYHYTQNKFAVIFIDVDNFKRINDSLGHDVGDELLKQFSERLEHSTRNNDFLAYINDKFKNTNVSRLGGDEFTILLNDIEGKSDIEIIANRIIEAYTEPFFLNGNEVYVTGSLGISIFPDHGISSTNLLKHADMAMYEAKNHGKNSFMFYSKVMVEDAIERLELESDLRKAFTNHEFIVYYQPLINITTKKIIGAEALIRWQHPIKGLMYPDSFIPLIEELGFITQLTEYVLRKSINSFHQWKKNGFALEHIAVNFSVIQFNQSNVYEKVKAIIDELKFQPNFLTIEITETVLMSAETDLIQTLEMLKSIGITISLDDFGTGYSSLKYLSVLPIDTLKIDRSFTSDITTNGDSKGIVTAIIAMAKSLNLNIIAEGVEASEQLNFLIENQVELAQGFYFSKAISEDEFQKLLINSQSEFSGL